MKKEPNYEPLSDYILIEPMPRNMTDGGIALPDDADPEPMRGRVIKVGPGRITEEGALIPMPVAKGDTVLMCFVYQQPIQVKLGGTNYTIVRARDLVMRGKEPAPPAATVAQEQPSLLRLAA